ncbi:type VI secretion system lipoprotein TssJ [uncultured Massilia sp.]|uniref:type VI secretion system lipoprotein TssJ n=1 Tax=uncultured Massilia sp. TaxID=169973 RepID=UPI0025F0DCB4|nr:type VI secretion system lipoprotein TssJ [uncultured Massilia sp.]
MNPIKRSLLLASACLSLAACAGDGPGTLAGATLEAVGLRKPAPPAALPDALQPPREVVLHLHAAPRLNLDARGQPLALLVRVFKLRQRAAFEQAPYAAFLAPQAEREALGADLVEARDVMLVPGQRLDLQEKLGREAAWIGVVALFHAPAPQGWRLAFAAEDAARAGVTIGLHACALSVGAGAAAASPVKPLSLVRCQ